MPIRSALAAVVALLVGVPAASASSFRALGDLPGGDFLSLATGVSADGSVVVGLSTSDAFFYEAFIWDEVDGMRGLGVLNGPSAISRAQAVSADGLVVVGDSANQPFIWDAVNGIHDLGGVVSGSFARAEGVSGDGSVVVGTGSNGFRWDATSGLQALALPPGATYSVVHAVSSDGSTIVGRTNLAATAWHSDGSIHTFEDLPEGDAFYEAWDVSGDGTIVVGNGSVPSAGCGGPVMWDAVHGLRSLGNLPGACGGRGEGVSDDGTTVIGWQTPTTKLNSFVWYGDLGIQDLRAVLDTVDPSAIAHWTDLQVFGVSADGSVLVGSGTDPAGYLEGWVAQVPHPSTRVLAHRVIDCTAQSEIATLANGESLTVSLQDLAQPACLGVGVLIDSGAAVGDGSVGHDYVPAEGEIVTSPYEGESYAPYAMLGDVGWVVRGELADCRCDNPERGDLTHPGIHVITSTPCSADVVSWTAGDKAAECKAAGGVAGPSFTTSLEVVPEPGTPFSLTFGAAVLVALRRRACRS